MDFYSIFRCNGLFVTVVCVIALGWSGLFANLGAQIKAEGE